MLRSAVVIVVSLVLGSILVSVASPPSTRGRSLLDTAVAAGLSPSSLPPPTTSGRVQGVACALSSSRRRSGRSNVTLSPFAPSRALLCKDHNTGRGSLRAVTGEDESLIRSAALVQPRRTVQFLLDSRPAAATAITNAGPPVAATTLKRGVAGRLPSPRLRAPERELTQVGVDDAAANVETEATPPPRKRRATPPPAPLDIGADAAVGGEPQPTPRRRLVRTTPGADDATASAEQQLRERLRHRPRVTPASGETAPAAAPGDGTPGDGTPGEDTGNGTPGEDTAPAPAVKRACCTIGSACRGAWRTHPACFFADVGAKPFPLRFPDGHRDIEKYYALLKLDRTRECMVHESVDAAFFDGKWFTELMAKGARLGMIGHSHMRTLFHAIDPMINKAMPGETVLKKIIEGKDGVGRAVLSKEIRHRRTDKLMVKWWDLSASEVDLADVAREELTDIFVGRGMWDILFFATPMDDLRVQMQIFLAELRRLQPRARLTVYVPHFIHIDKRGCCSLARQIAMRDAVYAAIHNVNDVVLPSSKFAATVADAGFNATDCRHMKKLRDPIRAVDVMEMTATPEAALCSDTWTGNGHHYTLSILVNVAARWLTGDNAVPPPPPVPGNTTVDMTKWKRRRERAAAPSPSEAFYDELLQSEAFHRYATPFAAHRPPAMCNACRRLVKAGFARDADHDQCWPNMRRERAICVDPVEHVLWSATADAGAHMDESSVACAQAAILQREW
jgi:hypothetical protein